MATTAPHRARARRRPSGACSADRPGRALLSACLSAHKDPAPKPKPTTTTSTAPPPACPLTGEPAPGGSIPQRPALAVKIDNYPHARPQTGMDKADIIFEEPVEGGITRYVAVFQCQDSTLMDRSARPATSTSGSWASWARPSWRMWVGSTR